MTRVRLIELIEAQKRALGNVVAMPTVVNVELIELVKKESRGDDHGLSFVCRLLLESEERLRKAEKDYLDAKSIYYSRLQNFDSVLER